MLQLYTIENNTITINRSEILAYPEFTAVLNRNPTNKGLSTLELLYVKFMADKFQKNNMYASLDEDERSLTIIRDIGLPNKWKPDATIKLAIKKYEQIQDDLSPTTALLQELTIGINHTKSYIKALNKKMLSLLNEIDKGKDNNGDEIEIAKHLVQIENIKGILFKTGKDLPDLLKNLAILEERVLTEYGTMFKKGGREVFNREDPENMIK